MAPIRRRIRRPLIPMLGGVLLAVWLFLCPSVSAETPTQAGEYEVKAGYLFNIAKFVEWPKDAFRDEHAPIVVAVLGEDPFGSALDALADRQVQGRAVKVKRARSLAEIAGCQVLFVAASEAGRLAEILRALQGPVLTVSDIGQFSARGGCITLIRRETKIGLEANLDAAQRARLGISSKLLRLAKIVKEGGP